MRNYEQIARNAGYRVFQASNLEYKGRDPDGKTFWLEADNKADAYTELCEQCGLVPYGVGA